MAAKIRESLFNYIPLLQLCNARMTRPSFLCKGVGAARLVLDWHA